MRVPGKLDSAVGLPWPGSHHLNLALPLDSKMVLAGAGKKRERKWGWGSGDEEKAGAPDVQIRAED